MLRRWRQPTGRRTTCEYKAICLWKMEFCNHKEKGDKRPTPRWRHLCRGEPGDTVYNTHIHWAIATPALVGIELRSIRTQTMTTYVKGQKVEPLVSERWVTLIYIHTVMATPALIRYMLPTVTVQYMSSYTWEHLWVAHGVIVTPVSCIEVFCCTCTAVLFKPWIIYDTHMGNHFKKYRKAVRWCARLIRSLYWLIRLISIGFLDL